MVSTDPFCNVLANSRGWTGVERSEKKGSEYSKGEIEMKVERGKVCVSAEAKR